jgi:dolichol kinase
MSHTLRFEGSHVALELHELLTSLDPSKWRAGMEQNVRSRLRQIRREVRRILEVHRHQKLEGRLDGLYRALQTLSTQLEEFRARGGGHATRTHWHQEWSMLRKRLQPVYGTMAICLERLSTPVPSLRPSNHARSIFHVCTSVLCLVLLQHVMAPEPLALLAVAVAVWAWAMEILRVRYPSVTRAFMAVLGPIAHPHEHHKVNSSTWYITALALLATLFQPPAASVALAALGMGDPAASAVGRRWGRVRLKSGRTLEGSLAFVAAATLAASVVLALYCPALSPGVTAVVALAGGVSGALGEHLSGSLDDNFTVPLAAAAGATLALRLLG